MPLERTLSIMKPGAISNRITGTILQRLEQAGLFLVGSRVIHLTKEQAEGFYEEHRGKPFFDSLVEYMTSDTILIEIFEGEDAITKYRTVIGNTDPAHAEPGTIRADFAKSKQENVVHGSDSPESASREIAYFFNDDQLFSPVNK